MFETRFFGSLSHGKESPARVVTSKPYLKYEIARMYGISKPTLMRWIDRKIGSEKMAQIGYDKNQKLFSSLQVEEIFKTLGKPWQNLAE